MALLRAIHRNSKTEQIANPACLEPLHQPRTMNFNRAWADSKFDSYFAIVKSIGDVPEDLLLARCQLCQRLSHLPAPSCELDVEQILRQCRGDRIDEFLRLHRLFEEVPRASHQGRTRSCHIAPASDDDDRQLRLGVVEFGLQREAADAWQMQINNCTRRARLQGVTQKIFCIGEALHAKSARL